ncbi:MAG TPA: CHAT domain-containing protein [Pyrinomonadaceae bacterium]|jgi:hypothetical protein
MLTNNYLNFDLQIQHKDGEEYFVIAKSPLGEAPLLNFLKSQLLPAAADFQAANPESGVAPGINNRLFIFDDAGNDNSLVPVASRALTLQQAKNFGKQLFASIFKEGIRTLFDQSIAHANGLKANLRIRLNLTNAPELAVLPWEYLCNEKDLFFAKDRRTPVVRYLNHDAPIEELLVSDAPLRVLVVISMPSNLRELNAEKELENIQTALRELEETNQIEVHRLENATFETLIDTLAMQPEENPYHVLHYIGHGAFNKSTGRGSLLLENEAGASVAYSSEELADILRNYRTLRLVVLNSCEGASVSAEDSYSGTAQDFLHRADVPAVIAMQYEISDNAALIFSRRFYQMIAKGQPIDEAVFASRLAMSGKADQTEWVTPVLYMRSDSGNLFDFKKVPAGTVTKSPDLIVNPTDLEKHYRAVVNSIIEGNLVPFLGLDANLYGRQEMNPWQPGAFLPSSSELAGYLAAAYNYPFKENLDLTSVSQYAQVKDEFINRLYIRLSAIFEGNYTPTDVHNVIAKIALLVQKANQNKTGDPVRRRFVVVTTNYDNLLEKAFVKAVPAYHVVSYATKGKFFHAKFNGSHYTINPEEIADPTSYHKLSDLDPVILKLPGAFDLEGQRYAITEDHYSDYLSYKVLSGLLPPQLTNKLRTSNNLFLGSSMRNWYLRALLHRVWEGSMPGDISWVVQPNQSEIDKEFWKASKIEVIEENFDSYISELDKHLQSV